MQCVNGYTWTSATKALNSLACGKGDVVVDNKYDDGKYHRYWLDASGNIRYRSNDLKSSTQNSIDDLTSGRLFACVFMRDIYPEKELVNV